MHRTTPHFWSQSERLPEVVQRTARRNFLLPKDSTRHASLHFKKVNEYSAVQVGRSYRAIAIEEEHDLFWVYIGRHDEYLRTIGR